MGKMRILVIAALVMAVGLMGTAAFANHGGKGGYQCAKGKGSLEEKISDKAHFLMKNQEELGLSDAQIAQVKDLKMNTKKDMIKRDAEIEILALDIKSALYGDTIDTKAVNTLIDKKYDLKKEKTKVLVGAYAALKEILTKEQKEKMKDLWKKCEKGQRK